LDLLGRLFRKVPKRKSIQWEPRLYRRTDGRDATSKHFLRLTLTSRINDWRKIV